MGYPPRGPPKALSGTRPEGGSKTGGRAGGAVVFGGGERDPPRPRQLAESHGIIGRRMAERCLGSNLMGQQRCVMNQQVHPGGQVQCRLMILTPAIRSRPKDGRAVVRNVGEHSMAAADPVTQCPAALMRNLPGLNRELLSLQLPWHHGAERPVAA